MYEVLYYSMTGRTRKLADAIAGELGIKAKSIKSSSIDRGARVIFLGSGSYGGKHSDDMAKFIENNDFNGRKVALFGTSGSGDGKEVTSMADSLKKKGAVIAGSYYCKGRAFLVVNFSHPDKNDLEGVKKFAREMINKN